MPTCRPPGSREVHWLLIPSTFTNDAGLRPKRTVSALPISHTPILMGGFISGLNYGLLSLRPVNLLAPPCRSRLGIPQPTEAFTSRLSTDWSPALPPDITTGATGQVPLTGLSPVRTPTSIAATARDTIVCCRNWSRYGLITSRCCHTLFASSVRATNRYSASSRCDLTMCVMFHVSRVCEDGPLLHMLWPHPAVPQGDCIAY